MRRPHLLLNERLTRHRGFGVADGTVAVFDIRSGLEVHRTAPSMSSHDGRRELNDIAVNPLTTLLVDAGDDGACHVYDMARWTTLQTLEVYIIMRPPPL